MAATSVLWALLLTAEPTDAKGKGKGRLDRGAWPDWNMLRFEQSRPCTDVVTTECCGDHVCQAPREDVTNCLADCPGVTTDATCGQEPRSDRDGRVRSHVFELWSLSSAPGPLHTSPGPAH
jgi:hypothetical protein